MEISQGMLQQFDGHKVFYRTLRFQKTPLKPSWLFLGGYASNLSGTKASFLWNLAKQTETNCTLFDYFGSGGSSGCFEEGTIGRWKSDALSVFKQLTQGPQILIGSSMGGWLALLLAKKNFDRIVQVITIAAAPDFPEELFQKLPDTQKKCLEKEGKTSFHSQEGSLLTLSQNFLKEAREHLILNQDLTFSCPIFLLHGTEDLVVSWCYSQKLFEKIEAPFLSLTLVQKGDHRLNRPEDLELLRRLLTV